MKSFIEITLVTGVLLLCIGIFPPLEAWIVDEIPRYYDGSPAALAEDLRGHRRSLDWMPESHFDFAAEKAKVDRLAALADEAFRLPASSSEYAAKMNELRIGMGGLAPAIDMVDFFTLWRGAVLGSAASCIAVGILFARGYYLRSELRSPLVAC